MFTFNSNTVCGTISKSNKAKSAVLPSICVTKGIAGQSNILPSQVEEGAEPVLHQMQIVVRGYEASYRGMIKFTLDGQEYNLNKTDTHCCWFTKQDGSSADEEMTTGKSFITLFERCAKNLDRQIPITIIKNEEEAA